MAWLTDRFKSAKRAHPVRRLVRELLAVTFWLHSLFILNFLHLQQFGPTDVPRHAYNVALLCFIFYYSFFSDRGWLSVSWDLLFVYAYPFVWVKRLAWWLVKIGIAVVVTVKPNVPENSLIADKAANDQPAISTLDTAASNTLTTTSATTSTERSRPRWAKPFLQFIVLWSILLLTVNNRYFIAFGVLITLVGVGKALWKLLDIFSDTATWTKALKSSIAGQIEIRLREVREWREGVDHANVRTSANILRIWEATFGFMNANRAFLAKCTWVGAIIISIPFYAYISFLFSCVYVGLAKAQGATFPWPTAFIDSLYIPFAFTDLPHISTLRMVAGLHCIALTVLGWNMLTKHLSGRLEDLIIIAGELRTPLQDGTLREQLKAIEAAVEKAKPAMPKSHDESAISDNPNSI